MTREAAELFAKHWIESWNAHDLEAVLSHYSDDFEMSSPFIARFTGEASGTLRGKVAVGDYWKGALEKVPDLHFELIEFFSGANSVTLLYKSILGLLATEVFFFNAGGQVIKAAAHYNQ
jgi:hypothetical protein